MATMKLCLVLLLCMLALRQCIPCEASRKMLMEVEAESTRALLPVSRKLLSEEGEEASDMEAELMLPDDEKLDIEQQEPLEKLEKEKPKEVELMLPDSGVGDLPSEASQDEKAGEEKALKKKKKKKEIETKVSTEQQESTGQAAEANLQEKEKGEKKKTRKNKEESSFTAETLIDDPFLEMGKELDKVEGLSEKASRSDKEESEMETRGASLVEEAAGGTSKEKVQTEEHVSGLVYTQKEEEAGVDNVQQYKEEDAKEKSLKPKKKKKEEVEKAVKTKTNKAVTDEMLKSEVKNEAAVKGEAVAEEITDEVTPADVIELEMQGGLLEEEKIVEKKQRAKEEAGTTSMEEEKSKQTEGNKVKETLKKPKIPKERKSELQVSGEEDAEFTSFESIDDKDTETNEKQKKKKPADSNSPSELQGDAVVKAGENSESQSKQLETQDKAKSKAKKKIVKSSGKPKKEGKSSEKKEMPSDDQKTEEEAEGEEKVPEAEIVGKVGIHTSVKDDTSKTQQSQVEKLSRKSEDELPTIEKQEEKLDAEVQDIAKEAQERAEGYDGAASVAKSLSSSAQGVDEDEDDYGDFLQDFTDFSTKFQDTALKVADHLGPNIQKFTDTSKVYFNKANQQITESFSPLVGKQFAPFLASLVSYGLLLVPLAVVILLFEHIRALLSLQKVLLFVNIYLAAYFATLLLATFIMGEPMNYFFKSSASGYVHLQILQALAYITYLILQTFDLVFTCTSETVPVKVTVSLQWLVVFTVGFHYYVTVFHRAMALKGPHTNWKIYGVYSIAFLVLCLFARIKRVKKGYSQDGQADTDKKH